MCFVAFFSVFNTKQKKTILSHWAPVFNTFTCDFHECLWKEVFQRKNRIFLHSFMCNIFILINTDLKKTGAPTTTIKKMVKRYLNRMWARFTLCLVNSKPLSQQNVYWLNWWQKKKLQKNMGKLQYLPIFRWL